VVSGRGDALDLRSAGAGGRVRRVRRDGGAGNSGQIVSGDPRQPVEAEEMWTFMRPRGGGWLLSAIQQV